MQAVRRLPIITILTLLATLGSWVSTPSLLAQADRSIDQGTSLNEALTQLEDLGLRIVFTSQVVRPYMKVTRSLQATEPSNILQEILSPHDLQAQLRSNGVWVVIPSFVGIKGWVRVQGSGHPLEGVRIHLLDSVGDSQREVITDSEGKFVLDGLASGNYSLEARLPGFVIENRSEVSVITGRITEITFFLSRAEIPLEEIVVTPSLIALFHSNPVAALAFSRKEIEALPHLGDDLFRALNFLPGTVGSELTAEIRIRGSRPDEVMVVLDKLELFDPFHFRDHSNALSIIAPQAISEVELILGSFPALYGDRMAGILDMRTADPTRRREKNHLGLSVLSAQAGHAGSLPEDRGGYFGVARFGSLDLVSALVPQEENPQYWDFFGKLSWQNSPASGWGLRALHAADRLDFFLIEDEDEENVRTRYQNSYLWLTHRGFLGSSLFVDSVISAGQIYRDRRVVESEPDNEGFSLRDERTLDVFGVKQDWNYQPQNERWHDQHYLRWGFDIRRFETEYDYFNERRLDDPFDEIHTLPSEGTTQFKRDLSGEAYSLYTTDRWRLGSRLTAELGVRYDEQTLTDDQNFSPRVNLVWAFRERSVFRAAWGHFYQSQRPYELGVEDGEFNFFPAEKTEQTSLGWEVRFGGNLTFRIDAYYRYISNPRPHYVNLYEPISSFPEIEPDRHHVNPSRSLSRGVELFLRRSDRGPIDWWVAYSYGRMEDWVENRWQPRSIDQTHTLNADLNYRINDRWTLNIAFQYHTGWPSTEITARLEEDEEGEVEPVPVFGPVLGSRLDDYHRLDLRANREWTLKKGTLTFFVELQNLYNRENHAGFNVEFDYDIQSDGTVIPLLERESWAGFVPSFGLDWRF